MERISLFEVRGLHVLAACEERVAGGAGDRSAVVQMHPHHGARLALECAHDSPRFNVVRVVIERKNTVGRCERFDRPTVDKRARRETLVPDDQRRRWQPVPPRFRGERLDGRDGRVRVDRTERTPADDGAADDAVLVEVPGCLLHELAAVGHDEHPTAACDVLRGDGAEHDALARPGRGDDDDGARTLADGLPRVLDRLPLVWAERRGGAACLPVQYRRSRLVPTGHVTPRSLVSDW